MDRPADELADRGGPEQNLRIPATRHCSLPFQPFCWSVGSNAVLLAEHNSGFIAALTLTVLCSAGARGVQRAARTVLRSHVPRRA